MMCYICQDNQGPFAVIKVNRKPLVICEDCENELKEILKTKKKEKRRAKHETADILH